MSERILNELENIRDFFITETREAIYQNDYDSNELRQRMFVLEKSFEKLLDLMISVSAEQVALERGG